VKIKSPLATVLFLLFVQGCGDNQTARLSGLDQVDLTGEWAVEWQDGKTGYKEIIYLGIAHQGVVLKGTGLDPDLISALVIGEAEAGEVVLKVYPEEGRGFHAEPVASTFKGRLTGTNSMEGKFHVKGQQGTWTATRTAVGTNRTVVISSSTKVRLPLTSEEYDLLWTPPDPRDHPNRWQYDESKKQRRTNDHFECEMPIGDLGGVIYHYRMLGNAAAIEASYDKLQAERTRALQQKILAFLNTQGYPWKSIPP
jgi:hypothetical protein